MIKIQHTKVQLTKIEFIALLGAVFTKLGKPDLDYDKLSYVDQLFGFHDFLADEPMIKYDDHTLKGELLKNEQVINFLCSLDKQKAQFNNWCENNNRKYDSKDFFPDNSYANIKDYEHLINLNCIASETHLNYIFEEYNVKRLYDYYNDFKKLPLNKKKALLPKYICTLTNYLGFSNFSEFKKSDLYLSNSSDTENVENQQSNLVENDNYTKFIGYYYDYLTNSVCSFLLEINFNSIKVQSKMEMDNPNAKQHGLHIDHEETEYLGNAYILNHKMHIILWHLNSPHGTKEKIKIILNSGNEKLDKARILKGLILASNSVNNSPISIEAIFKQADYDYTAEEQLRIERYLMIKRNNILVHNKSFNFNKFRAKNLIVDQISHLQGVWHSIRYDKNWNLVHSLLHIEPNYRITCYTIINDEPSKSKVQKCFFEPSEKSNFVLYISCKENHKIVSQIAIKLPPKKSTLIKGVMILHPINDDKDFHPIMRSIVLGKVNRSISLEKCDSYKDYGDVMSMYLSRFSNKNHTSDLYKKLETSLEEMNLANKISLE